MKIDSYQPKCPPNAEPYFPATQTKPGHGVLVVTMATGLANLHPARSFQLADDLSDLHHAQRSWPRTRRVRYGQQSHPVKEQRKCHFEVGPTNSLAGPFLLRVQSPGATIPSHRCAAQPVLETWTTECARRRWPCGFRGFSYTCSDWFRTPIPEFSYTPEMTDAGADVR